MEERTLDSTGSGVFRGWMEVVNYWYSKQEGNLGLTDPTLVLPEGSDRVPCIRWVRPRTSTYQVIRRMNDCVIYYLLLNYSSQTLLMGWHVTWIGETHTLFWWRLILESGNLEVQERNGTLLQFTSGGRWTKLSRYLSCGVSQATKACRGSRSKVPLIFNHGTRWR